MMGTCAAAAIAGVSEGGGDAPERLASKDAIDRLASSMLL
jgi:hypothetical protein